MSPDLALPRVPERPVVLESVFVPVLLASLTGEQEDHRMFSRGADTAVSLAAEPVVELLTHVGAARNERHRASQEAVRVELLIRGPRRPTQRMIPDHGSCYRSQVSAAAIWAHKPPHGKPALHATERAGRWSGSSAPEKRLGPIPRPYGHTHEREAELRTFTYNGEAEGTRPL